MIVTGPQQTGPFCQLVHGYNGMRETSSNETGKVTREHESSWHVALSEMSPCHILFQKARQCVNQIISITGASLWVDDVIA